MIDILVYGLVAYGRGRGLGFPTANIASKHAIIPSNGVYIVRLFVRDNHYNGIVNIGTRPTFDAKSLAMKCIEARRLLSSDAF